MNLCLKFGYTCILEILVYELHSAFLFALYGFSMKFINVDSHLACLWLSNIVKGKKMSSICIMSDDLYVDVTLNVHLELSIYFVTWSTI